MADLATLSLGIDSRPAVEAANALDKMGDAAVRSESKVGQIRSAADALVAALNRNTTATESLTAKMLAMEAAGTKAGAAVSAFSAAADTATSSVRKCGRATVEAKTGLDNLAISARNATAAWAELGTMGAATAQKLEIARRMASASAVITPPAAYQVDQAAAWAALGGQGATTARGLDVARRMAGVGGVAAPSSTGGRAPLTGAQRANFVNLAQQAADVGVTTAMGMSPLMIAIQQGPQIAQSFAGPGALSLSQVFSTASDKAASLAARVGILGGALGGLTTAAVAAVAAQQSFSSTQSELAQKVSGVGRASGVTVGQINALAPAAAAAGNVSVRSAREMAGEFAATGRIGSEMYTGLIGTARDYAATTGQELPEATKALAAAFADPARGADILNRQLGFLDAASRENITSLAAQGDRLGAQRVLYDAYKASLTSATELTSGWAKVTSAAGKTISDAWDAVGQSIDKALTGGDLETRITDAEKRLAALRALGPSGDLSAQDSIYNVGGSRDDEVRRLQAAIATLRKQQQDSANAASRTDLNQRSEVVDGIVKQFNPAQERLKQIEQSAARIRTELAAGVLDPDGRSDRTAKELESSAKRIREDLTQGGTQFANAIRDAQNGLRTVGFSPQAQRVASINDRAESEIRALQTDPNDPLLRDFQINSIRERVRIELETARQQAVYDTSSGSGRYARGLGQAPEQYRNLYYDAATRYGINPDLLVSQGWQESRFNPRAVSSAGAQGIAQFMPGTRRGMGDFDPFDPTQAIPKQAELMAQLLKRYNGNETAALVAYNAGPRRADRFVASGQDTSTLLDETRGYVKAIQTPQAGAQQAIAADVERRRGLENEQRLVEINTQHLGRNGQALEEQTRYQQLLNQAISEGREVTPGLRDELQRMASGMVSASRMLRSTEAGRGLEFERDQLGRTRIEQVSYGRARGIFGDVTSPQAQAYITEANDNAQLYEAKAAVTDAMGGFVTDLRRGTDAANAFGSMLGRLADRALNSLTDTVVSSLFSAGAKGGGAAGGLGGIFSSLGGLFGFANGGVMTSAGPVPLRAYSAGGIADSPQLALYGEGKMPEAYVPLPDGRRIPVAMQGGGAANSNGGPVSVTHAPTYNVTPANGVTPEQLAAVMDQNNRQFAASLPAQIREIQRRRAA